MLRDMSPVSIALICLLLSCFTLTFFKMFLQLPSLNFRQHLKAQFRIGFEDNEKLKAWHIKKTMHGPPFFRKNFLYLVQAEKCLPPYLQSSSVLGNASAADVFVLSVKEKCENNSLKHVHYFKPNSSTTWSVGRNILYQLSLKEEGPKYLYYIFMDDDLVFIGEKNFGIHPLRSFEDLLISHRPPIGIPNYCNDGSCHRATQEKLWRSVCNVESDMPLILPSRNFDAAINAFHYRAVTKILPYETSYEHLSWWESQRIVIVKATALFRFGVVAFHQITALNNVHRPYPRQWDRSLWKVHVNNLSHDMRSLMNSNDLRALQENREHDFLWKNKAICGRAIKMNCSDVNS